MPSHGAPQSSRQQAHAELLLMTRRLRQLVVGIVALVAAGSIGLAVTEHVSLWTGFVWTIDNIATVGAIRSPETTGGQVIKVTLVVLGVGTLFYALVAAAEFFVAGYASGLIAHRQQLRVIDKLQNHFIVCGFGRVGRQVAGDLRAAGAEYVVIDTKPESLAMAARANIPHLEGEAAEEAVLQAAGIDRARALIACVDSDAENVFITLTARALAPGLTIVARAGSETSEQKLRRAGANRVVSPYKASGAEMSRLALHPQVGGVLDVAAEYRLEEIEIAHGCAGEGRSVADVRGSAIVAAVRRADGIVLPQPPDDAVLAAGDVLVAMGTSAAMERLELLFASPNG
jgi:voltage-gated potassium channel